MPTPITRAELETRIKDGNIVLLEALPQMHYEDLHLPGALNLPHDQVDELAPVLVADKDAEIVVYCANRPCANSTIAARRLVDLGYTNVHEYEDGKEDWVAAGLPVEQGVASAAARS